MPGIYQRYGLQELPALWLLSKLGRGKFELYSDGPKFLFKVIFGSIIIRFIVNTELTLNKTIKTVIVVKGEI